MSDGGAATYKGLPVLSFGSAAEFESWLAAEHESSSGIWLKIAKKGAGETTVSYAEAVDVVLCYGWIDSQAARLDDQHYLQRMTPRKPRSVWSKVNVGKAEKLIAAGRMRPPGLREVEKARADGRWEAAYAPPSEATVPDDLQAALDAEPRAREFFATLNSQNRFAILYRLQTAKRAETRARRIAQYVAMLAEGKTLY